MNSFWTRGSAINEDQFELNSFIFSELNSLNLVFINVSKSLSSLGSSSAYKSSNKACFTSGLRAFNSSIVWGSFSKLMDCS
jgi:hypothetical protein